MTSPPARSRSATSTTRPGAPPVRPRGRAPREGAGTRTADRARSGAGDRGGQPEGRAGRTTSTINLGAALAEYCSRVLVDFDPQGALSVGLGVAPHQLEVTVDDLLMQGGGEAEEVIRATSVAGMDLLPSNIGLSAAEVALVTEVDRERALGRVLERVPDRYDIILIDCQPSLGLLTINALACANAVLIPLACEFFSLRGVALLTDTIDKVRDRLNPDLALLGVLATMSDPRTLHNHEVHQRVCEAFGHLVFDAASTGPSGSRSPPWPASRSPPGRRCPTPLRPTGAWPARSSPGASRRPPFA